MFWRCARLILDESIHVCKHEIKAYMKAKHTNIRKSYVFADLMYIFSENVSKPDRAETYPDTREYPSWNPFVKTVID